MNDLDQRFADGDDEILAAAYDAHGGLVYSFCRRQLGAENGRDVTQEIFVAAWRGRATYDHERATLRTWLMGIARNKVIDAHRHRNRRPQIAGSVDIDLTPEASVDAVEVNQMADRMVLAAALAELPDHVREVVELSFFEQLTHPEISDHTGIALGTVKSHIRRGLLALRLQLETSDD